MVFVEGLARRIHELVAGPGFRDQHHHGMGEAVAAHLEEFEGVVETGRVGLSLVGNRPQLLDVVAEQFRIDGCLARRHPVDVAAQRVDLAVVGDHAVGVGELPARKGIGGKALVDERQRGLVARIGQIAVVAFHLVGEEHALVDDRARRQRHDIKTVVDPPGLGMDARRDHLAQDEQPPLVFLVVGHVVGTAEKCLPVHRLGAGDIGGLRKAGIVDRHGAPADQRNTLGFRRLGDHGLAMGAQRSVARHEEHANRIGAGNGELDALTGQFLAEKPVGDLRQHTGAVANQRIGADRAAMGQILQHRQAVGENGVAAAALHVDNEADATGVVLVARIVEALRLRRTCRNGRFYRRRRSVEASIRMAGLRQPSFAGHCPILPRRPSAHAGGPGQPDK
jgi:hypothetical protein